MLPAFAESSDCVAFREGWYDRAVWMAEACVHCKWAERGRLGGLWAQGAVLTVQPVPNWPAMDTERCQLGLTSPGIGSPILAHRIRRLAWRICAGLCFGLH